MTKAKGIKYDDGKLAYDLLPPEPVIEVVKVLMHGAQKYKPFNWQRVEPYRVRYYNAAQRHIEAWRAGEILDPGSKLPHIAHAICCLVFILWRERTWKAPVEQLKGDAVDGSAE
jgi:hypothetical protein